MVLSDDLASVQKLKTLIEQNPVTSTAMSVRLVQQRKPHVKLTGVDPDVLAVGLIAQINSRNPDLRLDPSTCEVCVSFRERSGNFTHVVAVDPLAYRALMNRGRVSVGWTSATVVEDVHVPTCTFCATYGHGRRSCPVREHPERAVCTRRAGPHLGEQCTLAHDREREPSTSAALKIQLQATPVWPNVRCVEELTSQARPDPEQWTEGPVGNARRRCEKHMQIHYKGPEQYKVEKFEIESQDPDTGENQRGQTGVCLARYELTDWQTTHAKQW
ncbi:hypothetical protein HPB49_011396 [Dermacentor silvarum]|uniref:Uncharacterized protein n=1 Tax=Dermacentor silvarum TaxID=543639 RepID=A0ACB8DIV6_DERSI|nr:hypothetical protein HPB49_011396 [Dermacentor silvarum]